MSLEKLADELQYYNFIGESRLSLYTAARAVEPFPGFIKAASTQGRRNLKPQLYYPPHDENREVFANVLQTGDISKCQVFV